MEELQERKVTEIVLGNTKIYPGMYTSVKAQFKVSTMATSDLFTYTFSKQGVAITPIDREDAPEVLITEAHGKYRKAMNSLTRLDNMINERKTVMLEPEGRTKNVETFDGSYVRQEYGYAVCYVEDDRKRDSDKDNDFDLMAELKVGDYFRVQGKKIGTPEMCLNRTYVVIDRFALDSGEKPYRAKGVVFELEQINVD